MGRRAGDADELLVLPSTAKSSIFLLSEACGETHIHERRCLSASSMTRRKCRSPFVHSTSHSVNLYSRSAAGHERNCDGFRSRGRKQSAGPAWRMQDETYHDGTS